MKKWIVPAVICLFAGYIMCGTACALADHDANRILEWPELSLTLPDGSSFMVLSFGR